MHPVSRLFRAACAAAVLMATTPALADDAPGAATEGLRTLLADLTRRATAGDLPFADLAAETNLNGGADVPPLDEHLAQLERADRERTAPAADQRAFLRGGWKHHVLGYLVFSRALAFYVAANLLAAADRDEVTLEEAASCVAEAVASRQAIAAYFSFVLVQGRYEKLASRWSEHPSFGQFQAAVRDGVPTPALIARSLGRSYALLVPVVFTLEAGGGVVTNVKSLTAELRAGKRGAPVGLLGYLERDPRRVHARDLWSCVGRAFADVDYVELFVSQAAFVAGMGLVSLVPGIGQSGFAQLMAGFCCAELARRHLAAPLRANLVEPIKRGTAAAALAGHALATGLRPGQDEPQEPVVAAAPARIRADAARFAAAVDRMAEPARREFSASFRDLALAATARMPNGVTTAADHLRLGSWPVPFSGLFLDEADAALRLEGAVERLAADTSAAGQRLLQHLDGEVASLVGAQPWLGDADAALRRSSARALEHAADGAAGATGLDLLSAAGDLAAEACSRAAPPTSEARTVLARSLILVLGTLHAERALVAAQLARLDELLRAARAAAVDHARAVQRELAPRGQARAPEGPAPVRAVLDYDVRAARNEARRSQLDAMAKEFATRRDTLKVAGRRLLAATGGHAPPADQGRLRQVLAHVEQDFPDLATRRSRPAADFDRVLAEGEPRVAAFVRDLLETEGDDPAQRAKTLAAFLRWYRNRPTTAPDPFGALARDVEAALATAPLPGDLFGDLALAPGAPVSCLVGGDRVALLALRYDHDRDGLPALRQRFEALRATHNAERAALVAPVGTPAQPAPAS